MIAAVLLNAAFALLFMKRGVIWLVNAFKPLPRQMSASPALNQGALALGVCPPLLAVYVGWLAPAVVAARKDSDLIAGLQWTLFATVLPLLLALLLMTLAKAVQRADSLACWVLIRAAIGAVAAMAVVPLAGIIWPILKLAAKVVTG